MLKKFITYLWEKRFLQYFIVGSTATVLDVGSLYFCKQYLGLHPAVAVAITQVFALSYVFFLNKYWTFKSQGQTTKRMLRFVILMSWNYFFSIFFLWLWVDILHVTYIFAGRDIGYLFGRLLNVMVAVLWNFLLYKYWVYKEENKEIANLSQKTVESTEINAALDKKQ